MAILAQAYGKRRKVVQDSNADEPCSNNANPLDQLRDIHLPEPISWWP